MAPRHFLQSAALKHRREPLYHGRVIICGNLWMDHEIGALVLGCPTALFGGYGARELVIAFRTADFTAWTGRAIMAGVTMLVTALFAFMTVQALAQSSGASLSGDFPQFGDKLTRVAGCCECPIRSGRPNA